MLAKLTKGHLGWLFQFTGSSELQVLLITCIGLTLHLIPRSRKQKRPSQIKQYWRSLPLLKLNQLVFLFFYFLNRQRHFLFA
jgi:hypothetical protein